MFSTTFLQILRMSAGKGLSVIALILLPFPVSIPLALWLTRHYSLGDGTLSAQAKPAGLTT